MDLYTGGLIFGMVGVLVNCWAYTWGAYIRRFTVSSHWEWCVHLINPTFVVVKLQGRVRVREQTLALDFTLPTMRYVFIFFCLMYSLRSLPLPSSTSNMPLRSSYVADEM